MPHVPRTNIVRPRAFKRAFVCHDLGEGHDEMAERAYLKRQFKARKKARSILETIRLVKLIDGDTE